MIFNNWLSKNDSFHCFDWFIFAFRSLNDGRCFLVYWWKLLPFLYRWSKNMFDYPFCFIRSKKKKHHHWEREKEKHGKSISYIDLNKTKIQENKKEKHADKLIWEKKKKKLTKKEHRCDLWLECWNKKKIRHSFKIKEMICFF